MTALPEIVVDSFAGGGGASEGIERAMERMQSLGLLPVGVAPIVNIAINHDRKALAMHAANHPATLHLPCDIWTADPRRTVGRNPVGLLWASPDCRHHSKAKGGKPVSDSVRGLANVIVTWAEDVRPRMIFLENVEEFADWGPLTADNMPDRARKGDTFKAWVRKFKALGYVVDTCVIRACDLGAPTIRKRLYVMMRCDGAPIVWPWATHGKPDSDEVQSGALKPYRTAAEIIDWDMECPSILMDGDGAKQHFARTGKRVIRPLKENTERRVAKGIKRYVLDAAQPFIVTCNHGGDGFRGQGLGEPFATVTKARDGHGLVVPHMMTMRNAGKPYTAANEPCHTITSGGAGLSVVNASLAPFISYGQHGGASRPINAPMHTVAASRKDQNQIIAAHLVQHNTGVVGHDARSPVSTLTGRGTQQHLVAAHMLSLKGSARRASRCDEPHATVTGQGQHSAVVRLPLLNAYYGNDEHGADLNAPLRTISTRDRFGLVDCPATIPPMTQEQADSARAVAAFLRKYDCWDGGAFVTVGPYVVIDIGMRMLTPRELARAQGFGDDYILAAPSLDPKTGKWAPLTETDQRHKIGNSVCPDVAAALVFANYRPEVRRADEHSPQTLLHDAWDIVPLEAAE